MYQNKSDKGRGRGIRYLLLSIFIMVIIFIHSAMPAVLSSAESGWIVSLIRQLTGIDSELTTFLVRKTAHFLEYLFLGISLAQTFRYSGKSGNRFFRKNGIPSVLTRQGAFSAAAIGCIYAVTDEIHQYFVAGRSCEIRDLCIDAAGVVCGCLVVFIKKPVA